MRKDANILYPTNKTMKRALLFLAFSLFMIGQVNAVVVVPPRQEETPPSGQCYMQERQSVGLYRCFTKSEWERKQEEYQKWLKSDEKKKEDRHAIIVIVGFLCFVVVSAIMLEEFSMPLSLLIFPFSLWI